MEYRDFVARCKDLIKKLEKTNYDRNMLRKTFMEFTAKNTRTILIDIIGKSK